MKAVSKHPRVALRSGHKCSKSFTAVATALWWANTKPRGRVVLTATTNPQIRNILWRELKNMVRGANIAMPTPATLPGIGMQWADGREIIGFSTKESERMAGLSGSEMLFIVDEASGVDADIFEALEGNRAGGAHILLIGNPTQPAGEFFDAFHEKSEFYHTVHISSVEASAYSKKFPGLATPEWCEEKLKEWGPDSPQYHVRVLGQFAAQGEMSVIPLYAVTDAQRDWKHTETPEDRLEIGVDVARFGDDETVIAARRGNKVLFIVVKSKLDEHDVSAEVLRIARSERGKGERDPIVRVDASGVGLGVVSILRQESDIKVIGVNASEAADDETKYINRRAELWFALADWLRAGGVVPDDGKLAADMLSARFKFDGRNRLQIEKKDEIKKRLGRSPDRADAVALAVYRPSSPLARVISPRNNTLSSGGYRQSTNHRGYG